MEKNFWHGFELHSFTFEDREACIVIPETENKKSSFLLKTEYWDAFPDIEIKLVEQGFCLAYVKNKTRFATKEDCDIKARFVKYISKAYNLAPKCIPVGMSCGGAHAVNFAGFYPELIECMYIDAPVLNFCDFPGRLGDAECEYVWENEFINAYPSISRYKLLNFDNHPINKANILIESKIPVLMVYGTEDKTVKYSKNGALLEDSYKNYPELLTVLAVKYRGHHPHGMLGSNDPIVEYILNNAK